MIHHARAKYTMKRQRWLLSRYRYRAIRLYLRYREVLACIELLKTPIKCMRESKSNIRDEDGLAANFEIGETSRYGNDDDRADDIAIWLLKTFMHKLSKYHTCRVRTCNIGPDNLHQNVVTESNRNSSGWKKSRRAAVAGTNRLAAQRRTVFLLP